VKIGGEGVGFLSFIDLANPTGLPVSTITRKRRNLNGSPVVPLARGVDRPSSSFFLRE